MTYLGENYNTCVNRLTDNVKMPEAKDIYIKALNRLTEEEPEVSRDILKGSEKLADSVNDLSDNKKTKYKSVRMGIKILLVAVIVGMFGTTALAEGGYGPLAALYKDTFLDSTTAQIVEEGYMYPIGMEREDENFKVNFIGITGDKSNPVIAMDIIIKDGAVASEYNSFKIEAYNLSKTEYTFFKDRYGTSEGIGVRDEEDSNLFHVTIPGYSAWLGQSGDVIVDVCRIDFLDGVNVYNTDFLFDFSMNADYIAPSRLLSYEDKVLPRNGLDFTVSFIDYSNYFTDVYIVFEYMGSEFANGETNYEVLSEALLRECSEVSRNLILVADGTKYKAKQSSEMYCEPEKRLGKENLCVFTVSFDSIDYKSVKEISLILGGEIQNFKTNGHDAATEFYRGEDSSDDTKVDTTTVESNSSYWYTKGVAGFIYRTFKLMGVVIKELFSVLAGFVVRLLKAVTEFITKEYEMAFPEAASIKRITACIIERMRL